MANESHKLEIIRLRESGQTYKQIASTLGCAMSTVRYHLSDRTKQGLLARTAKRRAIVGRNTLAEVVSQKLHAFRSVGKGSAKKYVAGGCAIDDVKRMLLDPRCYLTGTAIVPGVRSSWSIDHVIPRCRGGSNAASNAALCRADVNRAKSDKTPEEFIDLCAEVLRHAGYIVTRSHAA